MVRRRFVIVALFDPMAPGARFPRRPWPAHLTLVSNFRTTVPASRLVSILHPVVAAVRPTECRFGSEALFGRDRDILVRLVSPEGFVTIHEDLAQVVAQLDGFAADDPAYWHDGYRPHVTVRFAPGIHEGDVWSISQVAIVQLDDDEATVVDVVPVAKAP